MAQELTIRQLLAQHEALADVSDSPLLDSQILMCQALDKPREWLYSHDEHRPSNRETRHYMTLVSRRAAGEPVAYLTGTREFWKRDFQVTKDTLIPRPETELLVETLLHRLPEEPLTVLDVGTGCGAIAVSLALERPEWRVIGSDLSSAAVAVARQNGADLANLAWFAGSLCRGIKAGSIDAIVSNPPYIREKDPHLSELTFEPKSALTAGPDGLDYIREIAGQGFNCLTSAGCMLIEHGMDQGAEVRSILAKSGFGSIETLPDIGNRPRATWGQRQDS